MDTARGSDRQHPGLSKVPLTAADLRAFADWRDGKSETELNFKLYRQGTEKVVGLSDEATVFLSAFF